MRNYKELTGQEIDELQRLYPVTPNRKLSLHFGISVDAIQDHFAGPLGWKKDQTAVKLGTRGTYHQLTDREERWIVNHYSNVKNADIISKYGISDSQLNTVRRKYNLKKSDRMMKRTRKEALKHALVAFREFGESERAAERARKAWVERKEKGDYGRVGFQKGESNKTRMSPKRYRRAIEKMQQTRNETIRRDRIRLHWGLEPKTKLVKNWDANPDWHKRHYRYLMRKKNYIVDKGDNYAYYDDETQRSLIVEQRAARYGLTTLPSNE